MKLLKHPPVKAARIDENKSVSDLLKAARLEHHLSLSQLSDITKISVLYLKAIEEAQYHVIPAKVYLYGFINNLCECFSLPQKEMLTRLKNTLQTEDTPLLQKRESQKSHAYDSPLLKDNTPIDEAAMPDAKQGPKPLVPLRFSRYFGGFLRSLFIPLGIISGVITVFLISLLALDNKPQIIPLPQTNEPMKYSMFQQSGTYAMQPNDSLYVMDKSVNATLHVTDVADNVVFFAFDNLVKSNIRVHERLLLDINADDKNDVELQLKYVAGSTAEMSLSILAYQTKPLNYQDIVSNFKPITVGKEYVLSKYTQKTPIQVHVQARYLPSIINYNIDGQRQDTINLDPKESTIIEANEHLEIVFGNYKSLIVLVNQQFIDLKLEDNLKPSITKIIKWIADPDNETKYHLIIKDYVH